MSSSPIFLCFLLLVSSASAFNITRMLDQYPDFSSYNTLLTQTNLASEINRRQTITILAVDNGAISGIYSSPADVQKHILSVHVILDYYDMEKLKKSSKKSTLLTTLFQSSGLATNQQGFINVTKASGEISMGSAVPGSILDAKLEKQVTARPYNISVLQVSSLIRPAGIDNPNAAKAPAKAPARPPARAPANAKGPSMAPAASPSSAPSLSPAADVPASSEAPAADAPASADAPAADAPASADAPAADGPTPSDIIPADSPRGESPAEGPAADQSSTTSTTATRVVLVTCVGLIVGVACMAFL